MGGIEAQEHGAALAQLAQVRQVVVLVPISSSGDLVVGAVGAGDGRVHVAEHALGRLVARHGPHVDHVAGVVDELAAVGVAQRLGRCSPSRPRAGVSITPVGLTVMHTLVWKCQWSLGPAKPSGSVWR